MTFPEPEATWRPSAETDHVGTVTGSMTRFVAPGTATNGEFGLFEIAIEPGRPGAMPHYHRGFSESFYVVSGKLAVMTGREWREAASGDFVHVPPRGMHAFRSASDELTRFLILFVPGAPREKYFRGLAEFGQRDVPPTPEEIDAFALECDQVNVRDWVSSPG
jgi:quercetin dioxygenase-like cupin family protein